MATKRAFLAFFALGAAYCVGRVITSSAILLRQGEFSARALRVNLLLLRNGVGQPESASGGQSGLNASIGRAGLLWNGCEVEVPETEGLATVEWGTSWVAAHYSEQVRANGYFFTTAETGDGSLDPVSWVAEASRDGTGWTAVGASERRLRFDGRTSLYSGLTFPTPAERGTRVDMDLRPRWQWVVQNVVVFALGSACFLSALNLGLWGCERYVKWAFVFQYGMASLLFIVGAAGHLRAGETRDACAMALLIPEHILVVVGLSAYERRIISALAVYGVVFFSSRAATARVCYEAQWAEELWVSVQGQGSVALIFALAASISRFLVLWRARRLVAGDKAKYDAAWTKLMTGHDAAAWVDALEAEVARLGARLQVTEPRQLNRDSSLNVNIAPRSSAWMIWMRSYRVLPVLGFGRRENLLDGTPVASLDQLYCQASCLDPVLRMKVRAWVEQCSGGSQLLQGFTTVYMQLVGATGSAGAMIKWGEVKSVQRAIEKVYRSYGQVSLYF